MIDYEQKCDAVNEPAPIMDVRKLSKFDLIRGELKNEFRTGKVDHLGKGVFSIALAAIAGTAGNVTQYFSIPFLHRIHRVEVKHTDAAYADSVDALTYSLKYGAALKPDLLFSLITNSATIISDTAHLFDNYYRSDSRYQLITNTTATDLLYLTLIIEIEDMPNRGE